MYSPQPHGLVIEGGGKLTAQDSVYVDAVVRRFLNFKQVSNLENLRRYYDLPNGGHFIVQYMGGVFKVLIYKNPIDEDKKVDDILKLDIPMLFCGSIDNELSTGGKASIKISSVTQKRLIHYADTGLPAQQLKLSRFHVPINQDVVPEFKRGETQYQLQRPTWYSGAMAEVMQIVGGYGKQPKKANFKDKTFEDVQMFLPNSILTEIKKELDGVRMPGYKGFPDVTGKYQYDYKFTKTHAVGFDPDGSPWLLQVSEDGLYAMPLPIIPATTTKAFKRYILDKDDTELIAILDRFKALPSGESFPLDKSEFEAWCKAGVIIKLCDTSEFYKNKAYSDACGWSFNTNGSKCFNTCYNTEDEYKVGYSYQISLSLMPSSSEFGWAKQVTVTGDDVDKVSEYLNNLKSALDLLISDNSIHVRPILYKLRASLDKVIERANLENISTDNEIQFWNDLELEPIANHSAEMTMVDHGFLYYDESIDFYGSAVYYDANISDGDGFARNFYGFAKYNNSYVHKNSSALIAFPDPNSSDMPFRRFDFSGPTGEENRKNCNTIMYGYYVKDVLKVIRYAIDWSLFKKPVAWPVPSFFNGARMGLHIPFKKEFSYGWSYQVGLFYTTDFDFRETEPQFKNTCQNEPGNIRLYATWDGLNKYYLFKPKLYVTESQNSGQASAIIIPYFDRSSFVHEKIEGKRKEKTTYLTRTQEIFDRYGYSTKRVDDQTVVVTNVTDFGKEYYAPDGQVAAVGDKFSNLVGYFAEDYRLSIENDHELIDVSSIDIQEKYTVRGDTLGTAAQIAHQEGDAGDILISENNTYYADSCRVTFGAKSYASIRLGKASNVFKSAEDATIFSTNHTNQNFVGVINE